MLVLDLVLLRLLDGDREVGSRLLLAELNLYFMDILGIQIYMYDYTLAEAYSDETVLANNFNSYL